MSCFFSVSNIFLIVILLDPPHLARAFALSIRFGALGNTFLVLFQPKRFFLFSDQFLQNTLVITPQNQCLICWRLLLSGFRSVLVNATNKFLRLKIRFVSRDMVPKYRATCTIASRVNFNKFSNKKLSLNVDFEVRDFWI